MRYSAKFTILAILSLLFCTAWAVGQPLSAQNSQDQPQQAEKPPHVDQEPHPSARQLEHTIMDAIKQNPHMAYSRVRVHVTDAEILLSGVVLTEEAKSQAEQIATEHAGGRKVTNHLKVNPNIHPAPGI